MKRPERVLAWTASVLSFFAITGAALDSPSIEDGIAFIPWPWAGFVVIGWAVMLFVNGWALGRSYR